MGNDYLAAILFFLPAGVANMVPVISHKIPWLGAWDTPLDLGRKWRGKRLLGDNKTWRGVVAGTLAGGITAKIVAYFAPNAVVTKYVFLTGCVLGLGALLGDAVESFFKRRLNIPAGHTWFPFDQTDYIIGGLIAVTPLVILPLWAIWTILVIYFGLHLLVVYVFYLWGIRDKPI
jgi:CDP-2,3-bis-(O-geranylgeranyl)-sn-glycerol synthase